MKIICIGRNYRDHAAELQNEIPDEPVVFCKPDSSLLPPRHPFVIPSWSQDVHHELEWVLKIGKVGKFIEPEFAWSYVDAMTVGIDFTARDIQHKLKTKGLPWEKAKGFDGSAVLGKWVRPATDEPHQIELKNNGITVQRDTTKNMLFPVNQLIAHISKYMMLKTGDILFTGTPAGVAAVQTGDVLEASLNGEQLLRLNIK